MSVARSGGKLIPVVPSSSMSKDLPSVVNRWRSSESSRENRENGRSLATNQPTVASVYAFVPFAIVASAAAFILSRRFFGGGREFKKGAAELSFFFFLLAHSLSPASPFVACNHGEVSPSTKSVSTDPERVSSKSRNRKRFPRIFTEFVALRSRILVNRIVSRYA